MTQVSDFISLFFLLCRLFQKERGLSALALCSPVSFDLSLSATVRLLFFLTALLTLLFFPNSFF